MLPPTHYHPGQNNPQAKSFREAIIRAEYARQNPNTPEGRAYQAGAVQRLMRAAEIDRSAQSLLDDIAESGRITAEDLAVIVS